jgi:hypothetical protein
MNEALNPKGIDSDDVEGFIDHMRIKIQKLNEILRTDTTTAPTFTVEQFAAVALVKFLENSTDMKNFVSDVLRTKPATTTFESLVLPTMTEARRAKRQQQTSETTIAVPAIIHPPNGPNDQCTIHVASNHLNKDCYTQNPRPKSKSKKASPTDIEIQLAKLTAVVENLNKNAIEFYPISSNF